MNSVRREQETIIAALSLYVVPFLLVVSFYLPINAITVAFKFLGMILLALAASLVLIFFREDFSRFRIGTYFVLAGIGFVALNVVFGKYGFLYQIENAVFLFSSFIVYIVHSPRKDLPKTNILFSFIINVFIVGFGAVYAFVSLKAQKGLSLPGLPDQNYTSFFFFLYLFIQLKKRRYGLALFGLAFVALTTSRAGLLFGGLLVVAFIVLRWQNRRGKMKKLSRHFYKTSTPLVFVSAFVGIILFSLFWASFVAGHGTVGYKEGINDLSNAIRFSSNVYAVIKLFTSPEVFFFGADSGINSFLGVNPADLTGGAFFNGFRVVQPHNCILNLFLRDGVFLGIVHLGLFCIAFSKKGKNIEFILFVGIVLYGLIMHSLYSTYWIPLIFLFVEHDPECYLSFDNALSMPGRLKVDKYRI